MPAEWLLSGRECARLVTSRPRVTAPCRWASDAVLYQIFVDRFARTPKAKPDPAHAAWGSLPTRTRFMGGTLRGITERLAYLQDLGVTLLYLTPIFLASANHRYNVVDYYRIDPRLGTLEDFDELIRRAHAHRIRVILDGVFNHCGRGFFPFYDVMENGRHSEFRDWFHIRRFPVDAYGAARYRGWQNRALMPILNLAHPKVVAYFLEVARYWTARGIDGWRLDAVGEVREHAFWRAFRRAVREINPGAYLLAEFWGDGQAWLKHDQFDGGTNYLWRECVLDFLVRRTIRADTFARRLLELVHRYPEGQTRGMVNLLGSHDTARIWTLAGGDRPALQQALVMQFSYPGIPALYYGDEVGLEGGEDPDNRRAMPWSVVDPARDFRADVRRLAEIRRSLPVLRYGNWRTVLADETANLCVFRRQWGAAQALIVLQNGRTAFSGPVDIRRPGSPVPERWKDWLSKKGYRVEKGRLVLRDLAPGTSLILTPWEPAGRTGTRRSPPVP